MAKAPFEVLASTFNVYRFKLAAEADKVWELPLMGNLPVKTVRKLTAMDRAADAESLDAMCEVLDELCPGLTDEVTMGQLEAIFARWGELSDISMGESSGSAD